MTERGGVTEEVVQRLSAEGADPLLLAGVNDVNLVELQRALGVRLSFRGDALTVTGTAEQVERAVPIVQGVVDLARMGEPVSVEDVFRLAADGPPPDGAAAEQKI
jgi:phosphate starvation-inducible protein PhoH